MNDSSKIKILFVIVSLGRGGAEKQLFLLLSNLNRAKFIPEVLSFVDGPWRSEIEKIGISVTVFGTTNRIKVVAGIFSKVFSFKPKVLHCFGAGAGFLGRAVGIFLRVPYIIASERYAPETKSSFKIFIEKILGYFTDKLVCNAEHSAAFYKEQGIIHPSKIIVVNNGVEAVEPYDNIKNIASPTVGYLANLRAGKNHALLIDAIALLREKFPDIKLLLAGDGIFRNDLEMLSKKYKLQDNIKFLGSITDTNSFFSQLNLYCHVSLYEGTPNAIMEAMARGIPCLATDIPGNRELIKDNETGILVKSGTPQSLASSIAEALTNSQQLYTLRENAINLIRNKYSIQGMVKATENIYEEAIK